MNRLQLLGWMTKWLVHLSGYEIMYEPRTAMKSHALADFVVDFSPNLQPGLRKSYYSC